MLISIWAITAPEPVKIGSFMNRERSSLSIWLYGNVYKDKPPVENPQCTSHDHCSAAGHILRQKVFYMLSRAVQCCYFFHGASTKCTFQLASCKYRSDPWICSRLPPAAVPRVARQSPSWRWLVPGCGQSALTAKGSASCALLWCPTWPEREQI